MKNILSNKKYLLILICVSIFIIFYIWNINKTESLKTEEMNNYKNNKIDSNVPQNSSGVYEYAKGYIEANKEPICKYFKDRVGIIKGQDILIGNSQKELENGYYDICISLQDNKLNIYVVKLWKDNTGQSLYDEYYVKELARCLLDICKKEYTEDEIVKMENYILDCYLESKKDSPSIKNITIENIKIVSEVKESILVMGII